MYTLTITGTVQHSCSGGTHVFFISEREGRDNGLYFAGATLGGAARRTLAQVAQWNFPPVQQGAQRICYFGRLLCAEMGVVAQQGEVSADSAWRSGIFLLIRRAESAPKARQLEPGLLSAQGEAKPVQCYFGCPARGAHASPRPHRQVSTVPGTFKCNKQSRQPLFIVTM